MLLTRFDVPRCAFDATSDIASYLMPKYASRADGAVRRFNNLCIFTIADDIRQTGEILFYCLTKQTNDKTPLL